MGFSDPPRRIRDDHDRDMFGLFVTTGRAIPETPSLLRKIRRGQWKRAGDCQCDKCDKTYGQHPVLLHYHFLHLLCNGDLVKL